MRFALAMLTLYLLTNPGRALAEAPAWTRDTLKEVGTDALVVCEAEAIARDLAYKLCIKNAQGTASSYFSSAIRVQSLMVQTERNSAFHEEVTSSQSYKNLKCHPIQEYVERTGNNAFRLFVQCRFSKSDAVVESRDTKPTEITAEHENELREEFSPKLVARSSDQTLILSVTPACDTVLVKGKLARVLTCNANPQTIRLSQDEQATELIIRRAGFKPKRLKIEMNRAPASQTLVQEVYLER